jgi:hypothetical protein
VIFGKGFRAVFSNLKYPRAALIHAPFSTLLARVTRFLQALPLLLFLVLCNCSTWARNLETKAFFLTASDIQLHRVTTLSSIG